MASKPDVFVVVPPPVYKDGFGAVNITLTNTVLPQLIPPLAKECGLGEENIINLFDAMGGAALNRPDFYCSGSHCDGYHPVDAGQNQMASTILPKVIDFYMKNPKGRLAPAPAPTPAPAQAATPAPAAAAPAAPAAGAKKADKKKSKTTQSSAQSVHKSSEKEANPF